MDTATAALIGASLGIVATTGGAVIGAVVTPLMNTRHARREKQLDLRREAYSAGLMAIHGLQSLDGMDGIKLRQHQLLLAMANMRLVGADHVTDLFVKVSELVDLTIEEATQKGFRGFTPGHQQTLTDAIKAFRVAARADLDTELPRRRLNWRRK